MNNNKLVSYCLFTYNQEKFISEAINGALSQTYSPLEIIISDDCSSDSTFEVIQKTVKNYKGPHSIIINRNEKNMGIGGHLSKICLQLSKGDYIVTVAGDDISKENHVEEALNYVKKYPEANMIDFNCDIINEKGNITSHPTLDFEEKIYTLNDYLELRKIFFFAPGRIIQKELMTFFGSISDNCPTEDSVLSIRSLLRGNFVRINKCLVYYRQHEDNITKRLGTLSNCAIISQYLKDVNVAYDTKMISDDLYFQLLKKNILDLKIRDLLYTKENKALINRKLNVFVVRILKLFYIISRKKNSKLK